MFENLPKNEELDDIFAESEGADEEFSPKKNFEQSPAPSPKRKPVKESPELESLASGFDDFEGGQSKSGRVLKKLLVVIIILLIIAFIAYFVYSKILLPKALDFDNLNSDEVSLDLGPNTIINHNETFNDLDDDLFLEEMEGEDILDDFLIDDPLLESENYEEEHLDPSLMQNEQLKSMDSDNDGLSDYDELYIYNTDPYNPDSDFDSLSDFDEIFIFGSDPLNPDTDNDGFLDGLEVSSGYSPLKVGGALTIDEILDLNLLAEHYPDLYNNLTQAQ